jgi:hypothetical protein
VLTGSDDNTAKLWDLNGHLIKTFNHNLSVSSVDFSPDGKSVLSLSDDDNTLKLWDAEHSEAKYPLQTVAPRNRSAAFSVSGDLLLVSSGNYFHLYHNEVTRVGRGEKGQLLLEDKIRLNIPWTPQEYIQSESPAKVQEYAFWLYRQELYKAENGDPLNPKNLSLARSLYEKLNQPWNVKKIDNLLKQ